MLDSESQATLPQQLFVRRSLNSHNSPRFDNEEPPLINKPPAGPLDKRGGIIGARKAFAIDAFPRYSKRVLTLELPEKQGRTMSKLKSYTEVVWTKEIDRLLGTMSDQKVGFQFGISPLAIKARRKELGVVPERTQKRKSAFDWTTEQEKLLGTMFDNELADQLGTSKFLVRKRRLELKIPAYETPELPPGNREQRVAFQWTPEIDAKLGTTLDTELAALLGLSPSTVTVRRQSLGIKPFRTNQAIEWTYEMIRALGQVPDKRIAREFNVSDASVKVKRIELGILPFGKTEMDPAPDLPTDVISQIGKVPDKQLSDTYKVHRVHIRIYRALHGIKEAEFQYPLEHAWTSEEEALLGTMSDGDVARQLQVPAGQVMWRRRRLGIPAYQRTATIRWTPQRVARLGQEPDHALAREWRCSQVSVREKRESLGIDPPASNGRLWSDDELALLGQMLDTEVSKKLGISLALVRNKRKELGIAAKKSYGRYEWNDRDLKRMGTVPDAELALELNLSHQFIAAKRRELGIEHFRRRKVDWTPELLAELGTRSDGQIARELGVVPTLVRFKRLELGIPAFQG